MSNKERVSASMTDKGSRLKDLPIGRDSFEEIRYGGFYYVDKTGLVKALLQNRNKVTLFTCLRRYDERLRDEGRTEIKAFGIAFCRKRCRVACADG